MAKDKEEAEKEYKEKFDQLLKKLSSSSEKKDKLERIIESLAKKGDYNALKELKKVTKEALKQFGIDEATQKEYLNTLKKINEELPDAKDFNQVAEDIDDLFYALPSALIPDRKQEELVKRLAILGDLRSRVFELATVRPGRLPDAAEAQARLDDSYEKAKSLLGHDIDASLGDTYTLPSLVRGLDPAEVEAFLEETKDLEKLVSPSMKASNISAQAHLDFLKNRTLLKRAAKSVPQNFSGFMLHLKGFDDSGQSLSHHAERLMGFVSNTMFSIAVQAEQAKLEGASVEVGSSLKNSGKLNKVTNSILRLAVKVQKDYDKFDKAIKLLSASLMSALSLMSIFFTILNYSSKATSSVVELLGTQNLTYGLDIDDTQLLSTVASVNAALNSVDLNFLQTYESRVRGIESYIKSGGSIKVLSIKDGTLTAPFRNFFDPLDTAAQFAPLLGKSQEDVMGVLGDLNSSTIMTLGQVEDLFMQVQEGSIAAGTPSSQVLETLLEMSNTFGGILTTFYVNQPILSRIAQRTKLNESQAFRAISGILSAIKGLEYLDIPHILTLAGFDLSKPEEAKKVFQGSLRNLADSITSSLAVAKNPVEREKLRNQLEMVSFYQQSLEKGDLYTAILGLSQTFPQALLGVYQKAIDGQIDLIYQNESTKVKSNALAYISALKTAGKRMSIPQEYYEMLVAARFTESGTLKGGGLDLNSLPSVTATPKAKKDEILEAAKVWYKQFNAGADQINQIKSSFISTVFEKAALIVQKIQNIVTEKFAVVAGLGVAGMIGLGVASLTPFGPLAALGAAAVGGLATYIVGGSISGGYDAMSKRTLRSLANKAHLAAPIVEESIAAGVPPAVLAALKVQETRDADFIRDTDNHIGHFQFDIASRGMTREQAYDIRYSARQAAREMRGHYNEIARRAKQRRINLTEAQIWGLAASTHALGAVPMVISGSFRYGKTAVFQSRLRDGASYEEVHAEVNRFMQEAAPWNTQEGGGGSYLENVLLHMENASQIPVFSGHGLTSQGTSSKMANTPDQPEATSRPPANIPSRPRTALEKGGLPTRNPITRPPDISAPPPQVKLDIPKPASLDMSAPDSPAVSMINVQGNLHYTISSENVTKVFGSVDQAKPLNFSKTNYYNTLYARNLGDIIRAWNSIVNSSAI